MLYVYDKENPTSFFKKFPNFKKIESSFLLSSDGINLTSLESRNSVENIIIDISLIMNPKYYNVSHIPKLYSTIKNYFSEAIFCINSVKYEEVIREIPLIFEQEEIEFECSLNRENKAQSINESEENIDRKEKDIGESLENVFENIIGHNQFKNEFMRKYLNFQMLQKLSVRKIFSVFLIGESGIGKTEFAKVLSKELYPNEELIKINFGNYSTEGVLNSLIGSPLGYIGSDEGGELITKLQNSRSKIILIDEFEKATHSVFNFFYELLEDGRFTDRHGKSHDLTGYTIIFTSNMTADYYLKHIPGSLHSRFDLLSEFKIPSRDLKIDFIHEQSQKLVEKINGTFKTSYSIDDVTWEKLNGLAEQNNLRSIAKQLQDLIVESYRLEPKDFNN
ncbi:MAG: ATP-dependent Clp protease ATP-binding subunit [Streptococcus gallolyticus]|uniref:ATP-dependent Clp protease ATP-binding subunit n=1 Tax=Streptococcus gallolyticus TaxID=315405 RepID=A0A927XIP4_9STRE|nr:ATP-dependent Clp protease ATP-binding subunit [Streptococcus gallolyticus]